MTEELNHNLSEKVRFLGSPDILVRGETPLSHETHMSWVFLTEDLVFKLKKPVRHSFLDFSSLEAREHACREELRINRVLAPDVYLRLSRLTLKGGTLEIDGDGEIVDWLVVMRRLAMEHMLDARIAAHTVAATDIEALAALLSAFYAKTSRPVIAPEAWPSRFQRQLQEDRAVILSPRFAINASRARRISDQLDGMLKILEHQLLDRVRNGAILEGHGDLRPEHVWLGDPIRVIDRIEFDPALRVLDPWFELAFLGMESAMLGADWIGPLLEKAVKIPDIAPPPPQLIAFYSAALASLRTRLSLAHLLDETPREPHRWEPQAERYLDQAESALSLFRR